MSCLLSSFAVGVVQVRASQADEGGIPGRMSTEENAARVRPGRREV